MSFAATWVDIQIIILSEVSPRKANMQNLKRYRNESIHKTEIESQIQKAKLWLSKGRDALGDWY